MTDTMTLKRLHELARTPSKDPSSLSQGQDWIAENAAEFMRLTRGNIRPEDFFAMHVMPDPYWIIKVAVSLDGRDGCELADTLRRVAPQVDQRLFGWWSTTYYKKLGVDKRLERHIDDLLKNGFRKNGWVVGTVKTQQYKGAKQLVVMVRSPKITYIKAKYQRTYRNQEVMPTAGDLVTFDPRTAEGSASQTKFVWFDLLRRP